MFDTIDDVVFKEELHEEFVQHVGDVEEYLRLKREADLEESLRKFD